MAKAYSLNGMGTMEGGRMPALNDYGQIANIAWTRYYKVITASITLTSSLSGAVILAYGQTAAVVVTLPAITDGPFDFEIISGTAQDTTITAGTADTMIGFNDVDLDSTAITASGSEIGAHFIVHCDGTKLFCLPLLACTYQATVFND
jgi:hypothetical protein